MTDRDHFAAAALTGLIASQPTLSAPAICRMSFDWADAMLRERANHIADAGKMVETPEETQDGPASTPQVPRKLPRLLSGLQELINRSNAEAGSNTPDYVLADFLDDVRHAFDAAVRERERWYGRRNHDAAPAARASLPTADHAVCRGRDSGCGTGDTRESLSGSLPADLGDGVSPSENDKNLHHTQEIAAYARFVGSVMNWISEATSAYASSCSSDGGRKIMADACCQCWDAYDRIAYPTIHGASPEARASIDSVAPQPTTHGDSDRTDKAAPRPSEGTGDTPAAHATRGEGSVQRECTEPVAWGVANGKGLLATSISRIDAVDMQSEYACDTHIVPLYRHPPCQDFSQKNLTLTDAEAETLRELRDEAAQYADEIGLCASEVRGRQRIIDGLLVRLGGER